jgi:stearoyl-CoA desaturase (delta-9 desaturase)
MDWQYWLACALIFLGAYVVNTTMITVFFHRGLAHGAVELGPAARWYVQHLGIWLTGLDPKGWVCMHRLHHDHSDTPLDPHSPVNVGVLGVFLQQHKSYERILVKLAKNDPETTAVVADLDFDISALNRRRIWWLPYLMHAGIGVAIAFAPALFGGVAGAWWLAGLCYWLGISTHPIEGAIVNSIGHAVGGRNFDLDDNSRNNHVAAWLIMGEGYQNNHHAHPASARFSFKRGEVDIGWFFVRTLDKLGLVTINRELLIDVAERRRAAASRAPAAPIVRDRAA